MTKIIELIRQLLRPIIYLMTHRENLIVSCVYDFSSLFIFLYQHTHITLTKCIIQSSAFSIIVKMPRKNEDSDESSSSSDEDDQNELVEDEEDDNDDDDDDDDDDEDEPEQDREPRQGMHWHHEPEEVRLDG